MKALVVYGVLILAAFVSSLTDVVLRFGTAERFSFMVLGLIGAVVLASGSLLKVVAMILLGLLMGLVGTDVNSGVARFSFDIPELTDGIGFVVIAMGVFGYGEIIANLARPSDSDQREVFTAKVISLLTLGIYPVMALMIGAIGAMAIHNIQPGSEVMISKLELFWDLVVSMNAMFVILSLPLIGIWIKLLPVPYRWLFPSIVLFCAVGVYWTNNSTFDVWMVGAFGLVGYVFHKLGTEPAPLLLGFILSSMMEENLRRTLLLSRGDWSVFVTRPLSAGLLAAAVLLLVIVLLPLVKHKREEAFVEG
ncbi:hypothetical protein D8B22_16635 [Verminephrobacter aporrectodeae subsp. tuberculatae]|nr:hypothetical protein [Verminephrobacter aporrectodeae subsp. tuberculatae]MCW8170693.1 hypothetical protein [Verminephrobacter aporrectodeae subsp. tuberculatae]